MASQFIEDTLAVGRVSFSITELRQATGLSEVAARNQLLRLGGRTIRVTPRQSFVLIVTPEYRSFGVPPVELWLDDYFTWLGRPYYLALQSAAAVHGSSPQAIQEVQVMTDRPMRNILFSRVRIRFYTKASFSKSLTQPVPQTAAPMTVSTLETTALDLVRYAGSIGGIQRAVETLQPLMPKMQIRQVCKMLAAQDELASAQRLGYIFHRAGEDKLAAAVAAWLPQYKKNVPLALSVKANRDMPVDKTYGVILNTRGI